MRKLKEFTCEMCGGKFHSYANHAKYCKYCRDKKQVERVQAHQDKLKSGTARQIGSEQVCPQCGKTFVLKTGNQKVCEECAKKECTKKLHIKIQTYHMTQSISMFRRARR